MLSIISFSYTHEIFNVFWTKTLVSSVSTSPSSPNGYCSAIGTRNSLGIAKNQIK